MTAMTVVVGEDFGSLSEEVKKNEQRSSAEKKNF